MTIVLEIPDELEAELGESFQDLHREMLESIAARAYAKGVFSLEKVRQFLKEESLWHTRNVLEDHGVWPGTSTESIENDLATLDRVLG